MSLEQFFALELSPLLLLLILARIDALSLRMFSVLWFIVTVGKTGLDAYLYGGLTWSVLSPAIVSVGFFVLVVLLGGAFGRRISNSNYCAVLSLGLFPWLVSGMYSLAFTVLAILGTILWSQYGVRRAFKKMGVRKIPYRRAEKELTKDQLGIYRRYGRVNHALVFLISALASTFVFFI